MLRMMGHHRRRFARAGVLTLLLTFAATLGRSGAADATSLPGVSTVSTTVVADAGPGAGFRRLVAARDSLYVVDARAQHVRRYILNGLPYAELFTQVMRWREGANGLIMGQPLDLALNGERLNILDSLGSLWSYWGPTFGRLLVPLRLQSNQGTVVAVATRGSTLLLLDPSMREVWTYAPAGGGYDTSPRPLTARPLAFLSAATRLAVSRDALFALSSDGTLDVLPWAYPDKPAHLRLASAITGLWAGATSGAVFVATADEVALLASSGGVTWGATVQGLDGETIQDVAWSPAGRLYLLTATRILLVTGHAPNPIDALT